MTTLVLGLLLFQAGATPATPPPTTQPPEKPVEQCVVAGAVVKAASGEPLKKALLSLRKSEAQEPGKNATTDANGRFEIKDIEPGCYHLEASRNGYASTASLRSKVSAPATTDSSPGKKWRRELTRTPNSCVPMKTAARRSTSKKAAS